MASPTQNSPLGGFTPTPLPTSGSTGTGTAIGLKKGEVVPEDLQTSILGFAGKAAGQPIPQGAVGTQTTIYGTDPNPTQYTAADLLSPAADPENAIQLQEEMVQAGLLAATSLRPGVWDSASQAAYAKVLGFANQYALNAQQALDVLVTNAKTTKTASSTTQLGQGVGGQGYNYFFPEYSGAAINTGFQGAAQQEVGSEDSAALPGFTTAFKTAESQAAAGKDIAKVAGSGTGGQYEQKPSPTDFAQQYLIQNDPAQVQAYGVASRMQDFLSMVGAK